MYFPNRMHAWSMPIFSSASIFGPLSLLETFPNGFKQYYYSTFTVYITYFNRLSWILSGSGKKCFPCLGTLGFKKYKKKHTHYNISLFFYFFLYFLTKIENPWHLLSRKLNSSLCWWRPYISMNCVVLLAEGDSWDMECDSKEPKGS